MPIYVKLPDSVSEVDVIIAGGQSMFAQKLTRRIIDGALGGLAGCVIAGRLAEAGPNLSILVIEQGPNNYEEPQVVHPALYPRNLFPSSNFTLFWQGNKSPQLADRSPIVRLVSVLSIKHLTS